MKIIIRPPGVMDSDKFIKLDHDQVGSIDIYLHDGQRFDISEQRDGPLDRDAKQSWILRIATQIGIMKVLPRAANSVYIQEEI